ncbi:MAG: adenosylmethionine--8-amino-7-oxononanoate transaminase [Flavobacteriales bacterium]|jgi:adenosylmethionine-8-amino-7-oxononanoate aminotransferase|nr:adenosylmethionine--8-amino-7-oxononanoate transaminase [Flavobacteriales bacterium]
MEESIIKQEDRAHVWHPFDQMKNANILPIVRGEGTYVYDEHGKKYIDGFSSWWVNTHGHCNPHITNEISKQVQLLEHVAFGGFTHPQAVRLAKRLSEITPPAIQKFFFSDNGSTANEVALKMAIQYWYNKGEQRNKVIALKGDYHGDTFGSMSATNIDNMNTPFEPLLFESIFIDPPQKETIATTLSTLESHLKTGEVACFIYEPLVQGASGMLMHDAKSLSQLLALCKQYNVLTIADEVFTGFGRTGKLFASNHLEEQPDIMCLSKGLTGGFLALGITAVTDAVYNAFYSDDKGKTFLHGHSYTGNPIACAAANGALDLFEEQHTWDNVERIAILQQELTHKLNQHPLINEARCLGTIAAVELKTSEATSYFNTKGKDAYQYFLTKGILLRPLGNVIVIVPPYCISTDDLHYIYTTIEAYLNLEKA